MSERDRLLELLAERSLRRGDFVLASGKRSTYYIDARLTTMSGTGQQLIGELGWVALTEAGWKPRAIGGLTLGADPVAYAIAHVSARHGQELDAFTVRKETKTHGTGKLIEGVFQSGWPVVIVEDVITTGESAARALQAVRAAGGSVLGVLAVVDREEGGSERLQAEGVSVRSLTRVSELL